MNWEGRTNLATRMIIIIGALKQTDGLISHITIACSRTKCPLSSDLNVCYGHEGAAGVEDLGVCFGEITADVADAKSEVLEFSRRYQEISAKPTLRMLGRAATSGRYC